MTSYNTSSYVKHSIESVLAQSYKNLEIIIVDDNSADDTSNLIKETAAKDRRVKFFTNKTNLGAFASKTLALKHTKGEFIVCHDSDDFAHCEWIERQIKPLLENSKFIASVSHWVKIDDNGVFYTRNIYPLLRRHVTSLMFKRAVLDKIGAWDIVRTGADSEFYKRLRIVFGKRSIKDIKLPLVIGAYRENSLTASPHSGYTSPARLAYVESYSRWHIECLKKGKKPIMTTDKRPFSVHREMVS
jgi:glycosyltransferase involved in cell wall biosynthesis